VPTITAARVQNQATLAAEPDASALHLSIALDISGQASIVDDVKLPTAAARAIRDYASLRKKADEGDRRAARAARRAVRVLRTGKLKMSARNAARLLGLSHQRVHQLTQEDGSR
jgi:hypothetical protein